MKAYGECTKEGIEIKTPDKQERAISSSETDRRFLIAILLVGLVGLAVEIVLGVRLIGALSFPL